MKNDRRGSIISFFAILLILIGLRLCHDTAVERYDDNNRSSGEASAAVDTAMTPETTDSIPASAPKRHKEKTQKPKGPTPRPYLDESVLAED